MPSTAGVRHRASYCWLLLVAAACNCLVVQSAKCKAGEFQVTNYTNEWTVSDATGTSIDGTAQPKVAVNMTIPIYFSAACTMSFFRNDIGLETDQITELSVTGGFPGSVQQLQSTQYTYDGSRFIKFFFPNSPMTVASGQLFTATVLYKISSPICRSSTNVLRFEESWTHWWKCKCVDKWVYRLCVPAGNSLWQYSEASGGTPVTVYSDSKPCYEWSHASAPSSGFKIDLDETTANVPNPTASSCASTSGGDSNSTLIIILSVVGGVLLLCVLILMYVLCCRDTSDNASSSDVEMATPAARAVPVAAPISAPPTRAVHVAAPISAPPAYEENPAIPTK